MKEYNEKGKAVKTVQSKLQVRKEEKRKRRGKD